MNNWYIALDEFRTSILEVVKLKIIIRYYLLKNLL